MKCLIIQSEIIVDRFLEYLIRPSDVICNYSDDYYNRLEFLYTN